MKHFPFGPYNCCNATEIAEHKKKMKKKNRIKNIFTRYSCCHRKFTNSKMESVATNFNLHYIRFPSLQFSCYTFPPPQPFFGGQQQDLPPSIFQLDFPFLSSDCCAISFVLLGELLMFYAWLSSAFGFFSRLFVLFANAGHFYEISAFVAYVLSISVIKLTATSTGFVLPAVAK